MRDRTIILAVEVEGSENLYAVRFLYVLGHSKQSWYIFLTLYYIQGNWDIEVQLTNIPKFFDPKFIILASGHDIAVLKEEIVVYDDGL